MRSYVGILIKLRAQIQIITFARKIAGEGIITDPRQRIEVSFFVRKSGNNVNINF